MGSEGARDHERPFWSRTQTGVVGYLMVAISGQLLAIFWDTVVVPWAVVGSFKLKAR